MYKKSLIMLILLSCSGRLVAQTTPSSPLFSCTDLIQTIQNKAGRTKINFNGNTQDFANDLIEKVVKPGYSDYITMIYSNANRDVSQQERDVIVVQSLECIKKINFDFNNSNAQNINCGYKFAIPTTAWKFNDNRKKCISCKQVYVSYTKNNLVDAKKNATAAIIRANLEDHLNKTNASEEHKRSDEKKLNQFLVNNNFGMMGVLSSMFQASMGEMKGVLYGTKKAFLNQIDLYEVENSRFCSPKCEYFYNHR